MSKKKEKETEPVSEEVKVEASIEEKETKPANIYYLNKNVDDSFKDVIEEEIDAEETIDVEAKEVEDTEA